MGLRELSELPREWLTSSEVAAVLGMDSFSVVVAARTGALPFPHLFSGNRLKVFKRPFLEKMGYSGQETSGCGEGVNPVYKSR